MRARSVLLSVIFGIAASSVAAAPRPAAQAGLSVVQSGGEAALLLDGTIMPRPFGGTLVDRLTVVDRYAVGPGRSAWLVRGDGGDRCASQYVVVERATGQQPDVSSIFGCDAKAVGRLSRGELRIAVTADGLPPSELAWRRGVLEPADPVAAATQADLGCANPAATPAMTEAALAEVLPPQLRRRADLKRAVLADGELETRMGDLACLSTWPGGDKAVAEAARPLFASKTLGASAIAALDRMAVNPAVPADRRAAARLLSGRMRFVVASRDRI